MPLNGKTILVTGGTGSFGQKFIKTILERFKPKKLIVFSRDELKQFEMSQEFLQTSKEGGVRYFLGDVRDIDRLRRAFDGVDIIVHAAALKQIPACEYNPFEAVKTNILGTQNVVDASIDCGVEKVLALSTDKAVSPVNLYGGTKLCAEKLVVHGNLYSRKGKTIMSCARYGNVMGSRGSVVLLFLEQRKKGKITVTDPRMTRFFITLEQGIDFIINCLQTMNGGEVFVPKIPSMRIMDLVEAIAPGCEVETIGVRPGEKIHELLISQDESRSAYDTGGMYVILPSFYEENQNIPGDAKRVPDDFTFSSDANEDWLSVEQLRDLV